MIIFYHSTPYQANLRVHPTAIDHSHHPRLHPQLDHAPLYPVTPPTSDVGEEFPSGGSPEVETARPHAGHQVTMTSGQELEQGLVPCGGLGTGPNVRIKFLYYKMHF